MKRCTHPFIDETLVAATNALLETYGSTEPSHRRHDGRLQLVDDAAIATIGFIGPSLRGSLMLCAADAFIQSTLPPALRGRGESGVPLLLDWFAELANQLLGRIKRGLYERDVDFELAPPSAFWVCSLTIPPIGPNTPHHFEFRSDVGQLLVCLDVRCARGWSLPPPGRGHSLPAEGDFLLF